MALVRTILLLVILLLVLVLLVLLVLMLALVRVIVVVVVVVVVGVGRRWLCAIWSSLGLVPPCDRMRSGRTLRRSLARR